MTEDYRIEARYFRWLYSHIGAVSDLNPSHTHWMLAEVLHNQTFEATVPNDENRESDGISLRDEFCDEWGSWEDSRFIFEPCTFLEMLIGLAQRVDYLDGGDPQDKSGVGRWFWVMLRNAHLDHISDDLFAHHPGLYNYIVGIVERINERTYASNGSGGLFPLENPKSDVRGMELWYQANAYLIEHT